MNHNSALLHSPAAERNRQPILEALLTLLPSHGRALEIASGSGQHLEYFSRAMPGWQWLGSDPSDPALESIAARCPHGPRPLKLDVAQQDWHLPTAHCRLDLIYCANMLHISAWSNCAALMRGAAYHLSEHGLLIVYGPFIVPGETTAPSNLDFDAELRRRDPAWGLRSLAEVDDVAKQFGLRRRQRLHMPANNLLLVFEPHRDAAETQALHCS
ncbi:DUF938 domain-containing protein [Paucibacter sp. AS339]|uniref:DUF938 domain-containing protein n=1 Tax=Paucibacter hankyongi TaxID=3133434 RepID=UPI0030B46796